MHTRLGRIKDFVSGGVKIIKEAECVGIVKKLIKNTIIIY